jgi:hypothetical protein
MALALVVRKTFFSLLEVTRKGAKGVCRIGYSAAFVLMSIGCGYVLFGRRALRLFATEPSGPNLLDELLSGFI